MYLSVAGDMGIRAGAKAEMRGVVFSASTSDDKAIVCGYEDMVYNNFPISKYKSLA